MLTYKIIILHCLSLIKVLLVPAEFTFLLSYVRQFRAWTLWHVVVVRVAPTLECMGALSPSPTFMLPHASCEKCEKLIVSMRGLDA